MSSRSNGKALSNSERVESNEETEASAKYTTISKNVATNLRPRPDIPRYTLPNSQKPETEEQEIVYEKEKLLSIVAGPEESWNERKARVEGRRKSLEVAAIARWGANLRDLDMLDAERQRWKEYDEAKTRPKIA